jgi:hypothetical protein
MGSLLPHGLVDGERRGLSVASLPSEWIVDGQILEDRVASSVGDTHKQAIGSLLPDGLVDVESLGLIVASLLSE